MAPKSGYSKHNTLGPTQEEEIEMADDPKGTLDTGQEVQQPLTTETVTPIEELDAEAMDAQETLNKI